MLNEQEKAPGKCMLIENLELGMMALDSLWPWLSSSLAYPTLGFGRKTGLRWSCSALTRL